ncbi:MAG: FAD:protein FMN transferase [Flavobacteriales bacterium]
MKSRLGILLFILFVVLLFAGCGEKTKPLQGREYNGVMFGLPYHIEVVGDSTNYQQGIDSVVKAFEDAYNLADPNSVLSRYNTFNRTDTMFVFNDSTRAFGLVYDQLRDFNRHSLGYFDPTTNPLKRAWFYTRTNQLGEPNLDSLFEFVGFDGAKMDLIEVTGENYQYQISHMRKADARIEADFTRFAAAVTMDNIGDYLKSLNVLQFRIIYEQSVLTFGNSVDGLNIIPMGLGNDSADQKVRVINRAFAYKQAEDKVQMVDPTYGYLVENEMMYVAVSAKTMAESEVYAEAFTIMGLDKMLEFYNTNPETDIQSYVFYLDNEVLNNASTNGLNSMLVNDSLVNQ